jgi:alkanesulfonate monooxygenase SsuD/methylene tetrahydromethanopterin reductase-like flavin-dependent oxidoreductase (luciferase family)
MRLAMMLEGQEGPTYDDILAVARRVEATGLAGLYRSDHYTAIGTEGAGSTDAWATLAGLARDTRDIRLGTLVSPATFRPAGNLAKVAATVAAMAGTTPEGHARVSLGLGTGWWEPEHRQHGFPFEDLPTRFRRLEEHLAAVNGLWDAGAHPYDQDGEFVRLQGAQFRPVPDPRPDIVVGGRGLRRTPALAARYAQELNAVFLDPEGCAEQRAALARACEDLGRDPATVRYTLMTGCVVGATQAELEGRLRRLGTDAAQARHDNWIVGLPEEAADQLGRLGEAGVEGVMLQNLLYDDLDVVDLVAAELAPRLS